MIMNVRRVLTLFYSSRVRGDALCYARRLFEGATRCCFITAPCLPLSDAAKQARAARRALSFFNAAKERDMMRCPHIVHIATDIPSADPTPCRAMPFRRGDECAERYAAAPMRLRRKKRRRLPKHYTPCHVPLTRGRLLRGSPFSRKTKTGAYSEKSCLCRVYSSTSTLPVRTRRDAHLSEIANRYRCVVCER